MMHIVKHKQDPINAIIRSKDGNTIEMKTMTITTKMRTANFAMRITVFVDPLAWRERKSFCELRPQRISTVAMSGRQLKVLLVLYSVSI